MNSQSNKTQLLELMQERARRKEGQKPGKKTVYGVVCPKKGFLYGLTERGGKWIKSIEPPDIYVPKKLERVLKSTKRFIVLIGGRGSGKSIGVGDLCIADAKDNGNKTYCLREFQASIKNSVHSMIKSEISRLGFFGFNVLGQSIGYEGSQAFEFAGLSRNIDSVKSTHGFKRFTVEEAQFISQGSLDALTPTIREKPKNGLPRKFKSEDEILEDIGSNPDLDKVSIVFIANPGSSADPFSKRFIEPFKKSIDKDGYYEDELHLVVKINYDDNPWFDDSGLEAERLWDYANRSRAYYRHRWHGEYNDSVDNSIIQSEWFDACIDAHKSDRFKNTFKPHGAKIAAHDPFDDGGDAGGYAQRHGPIITHVKSKDSGEIDEVCDWATGEANKNGADWFVWDGDGMGTGLKRQVSTAFAGTNTKYHMFRGSLSGVGQDNAKKVYMPQYGDEDTKPKTYAETFKNNRAQYYTELATRCYNTYRCVIKGDYVDPDEMLSLDSDGIEDMIGLRSEMCRIPSKPNPSGLIQIMSKQEMKKNKIDSPNEADSVMMTLFKPTVKTVMEPLNYPSVSIV